MMLKRYWDILLYTVISYQFLLFVGDTHWWQTWLKFWQNVYYDKDTDLTLGFPLQIVFVLTGLLITNLASHFQIYHPNRPLRPCFRFPPLTFSVGLAVLYWAIQSQPQLLELMTNSWGILVGLLLIPLLHLYLSYRKCSKSIIAHSSDLPKYSLSDLNSESKHSAMLLLRELNNNSRHIALCGAFGTGKTSVINAVLKQLKLDEKEALVHCNIDLWGIGTSSVVQFVLDEITLALSEHLDVSGLRRLPANYLEAIRTSNSSWSFISSLLDKHESPDIILKRLDELLQVTGKKLVVTIQDIDRNENAKSSMIELAGLLERLKQHGQNIIYIFAAENTPEFSETIRRICPVRVDITKPHLFEQVVSLHKELADSLPPNYFFCLSGRNVSLDAAMIADLLPSYRAFHALEKMVLQAWGNKDLEGQLFGEVYPHELILMYALKNEYPQIYDLIIHAASKRTENSLAVLLLKHMPKASESEKDFLVTVFKSFGFLDESLFEFSRLAESDDVKSGAKETDSYLSFEFESAPDVLSIINADRKRLIQRGAIFDTDFSHSKAYLLFQKIADGQLEHIDDLILKTLSCERNSWLHSLNMYGIRVLFTSAQDHKLPQSIIHAFLSVPEAVLSHSLMMSIDITIKNSAELAPDNCFIRYITSDMFCDDVMLWIKNLKASALGDIIFILTRISAWERQHDDKKDVNAKSVIHSLIHSLVMDIAKEKSEQSEAILISLFKELGGNHQPGPLWKPLGEGLTVEDLELILQRIENVDLDSISFLMTYQQLYPEYNTVQSTILYQDFQEAKSGVERLKTYRSRFGAED